MDQARCLIVTTHFRPLIGGALTVYDALAERSSGAVSILTAHNDYTVGEEVDGWQEFDASASYHITRVPNMRLGFLPEGSGLVTKLFARLKSYTLNRQILRKTVDLVRQQQIDVVCIGAQDALGWMVKPLQRLTGAKVIIFVHGEEVSQAAYSEKAEAHRRSALQAANGLVAVSSFTADILERKYGVSADKITLQTNGVDLTQYDGKLPEDARKANGLPSSPFVFACGRLVERKGFDKLIEAWPTIVAAVPGANLAIGGRGPLEGTLKERIAELGLESSVQMLGWMSTEELHAAYGVADVFTMPNRTMPDGDTEGFGLVFLEAAAMGTPSVGGRAGGAVDAIIDGKTGLFVDGNHPEEIAEALIKILSDTELRYSLAARAQAHAQSQGWDAKAKEFMSYLNKVRG